MSPEFWQRLLAAELPPARCRDLLEGLGTSLFQSLDALYTSPYLKAAERERARQADMSALETVLKEGVKCLEPDDYPDQLRDVQLFPPVLFAWGDTSCLNGPTVAIVGTRNASTYGKGVAYKFAESLARAGVTVVSGGALGIDAAAHKGALAGGGKTAAVLITGIEKVYPRENYGLFQSIKQSGCLLSQFAVGTRSAWDYRPLIRNSTVAALSSAVLVIEAPTRSGALSTANAANDLGRPVYVVPANIENPGFKGSHNLIRDGATLVDHPNQLLESLEIEPVQPAQEQQSNLTEPQKKILSVLTTAPLASEFIVERTGLDTVLVLSELTMLELDGLVIRDIGGFAKRP